MNLYISDLDGTLINSSQEITPESAAILNRLIDKGLCFTVATARAWDSTRDVIAPLNIKLPIILGNGAFIYDPVKEKNLLINLIDASLFEDILNICDEMKLSPLIFSMNNCGTHRIYYRSIENKCVDYFVSDRVRRGDERLTCTDDFGICTGEDVYTVSFGIDSNEIEDLLGIFKSRTDLLVHYHEDVYIRGYFWLEIANLNATKSHAALFLKDYLRADRLICFGDNLNDCSMFEAADSSYAVSNAHKMLKACASGVIGSNNEDGVARFLEKNFKV